MKAAGIGAGALALALAVFAVAGGARAEVTASQLNAQLNAAVAERRRLQRENPAVEFAKVDSPVANIKKASDQRGGRYPYGVTVVNRAFHCPFCKATNAAPDGTPPADPATPVGHGYGCGEKGRTAELKWRDTVAKVAITSEFNTRIDAKTAEIDELKRRMEDLHYGRAVSDLPEVPVARPGVFESLFGVKFGSTPKFAETDRTDLPNVYFFHPARKFRRFDEYMFGVTAKGGRVWMVRAEISTDRLGLASDAEQVVAVMTRKYGVEPRALPYGAVEFDFGPEDGEVQRKIVVLGNTITAFDVKLRERAWEEDPSLKPVFGKSAPRPATDGPAEEYDDADAL